MKTLEFVQTQEHGHWVGDGFPVRSVFSYHERAAEFSPFLLLDYGGPASFEPVSGSMRRGVGEHPHRGFETVTIVYAGEVEHRDSTGAGGIIGPGDVQWMTAGGGIVHEEFHGPVFSRSGGLFEVVQLWVNLPARDKMVAPGYQPILDAEIPQVEAAAGVTVRVIAGCHGDVNGPARTFTPMNLWDVRVVAGARAEFILPEGYTTAVFVLRGRVRLDSTVVGPATVAVFSRQGRHIVVEAEEDAVLLLLNGEPIDEPIVGHGPFVMNSEAEIRQAMLDYRNGRMGRIARSAREVETV
ncbi:MAG: pirin family protein [Gammaproteobacteria bacterium]|jgi:redox-sensitive bicupin YhaK (pirin superfamily)|nr:pirin family protein [Gammaproteobacteria bacterium]